MSHSTQCPACQVVLKIPEEGIGRRLRCPKCGHKFLAGPAGSSAAAGSSALEAGVTSTDITSIPAPAARHEPPRSPAPPARQADLDDLIPLADRDLRETFDPSMLGGTPAPSSTTADASLLFADDPPPKKKLVGDLRHTTRPCTACGSNVSPGTVICTMCGLNQETGEKIDLGLDDMVSLPEQLRKQPIPIGVGVVGGVSALGSLGLAIYSLVAIPNGQYFALVAAFGVVGAVQFLRGRGPKPLLAALTLGAAIAAVALIAMPVWNAIADVQTEEIAAHDEEDPDAPKIAIRSSMETLDQDRIVTGIFCLLAYAGVASYLVMSRAVKRYSPGGGGRGIPAH